MVRDYGAVFQEFRSNEVVVREFFGFLIGAVEIYVLVGREAASCLTRTGISSGR